MEIGLGCELPEIFDSCKPIGSFPASYINVSFHDELLQWIPLYLHHSKMLEWIALLSRYYGGARHIFIWLSFNTSRHYLLLESSIDDGCDGKSQRVNEFFCYNLQTLSGFDLYFSQLDRFLVYNINVRLEFFDHEFL